MTPESELVDVSKAVKTPEKFEFPFPPYDIQHEFMTALFNALNKGISNYQLSQIFSYKKDIFNVKYGMLSVHAICDMILPAISKHI